MRPTHAPPRSRVDPFADFTSDHGTILSSLASERKQAAEKQETARNAGNLLRRMRQEQNARQGQQPEQQPSAARSNNTAANSEPRSQLARLRETMSQIRGGGSNNNHDGDIAGGAGYAASASNSPSRADFGAFLGSGVFAAATAGRGGGAATANTSPGSSVDPDHPQGSGMFGHYSPAATTPGGNNKQGAAGLSSNTAQHILRDMQGLRDSIGRLEQHLMGDMKRRVEAHAALQRTVEIRVREIAENAEKRGQDRMVKLHHTLDSLTQRIGKLEGALAVEREKNARLVQELKYHSVRGLQDVRQQLVQERNARSERIASASSALGQELFRVEEHIAVAKRAREGLAEEVRDAVMRAQEARTEAEDKLLKSLMNDIKQMRARLDEEQRQREEGEEQLAGAMADLATHLQQL